MNPKKRLTVNAGLNLMGQALPLVLGVVFVPPLIRILGDERFALLSIAWTLIGVFTLFDFGLGRAVTHSTSMVLGTHDRDKINGIVSSGALSAGAIGVVAGLAVWAAAPFIVVHLKNAKVSNLEMLATVRIIAAGIPLVTVMSALRGFLESVSRFKFINIYRIVIGAGSFVLPFLLAKVNKDVSIIVGSLVLLRLVSLLHHVYYIYKAESVRIVITAFSASELHRMLRFGGWMTVSSVVGSLMVYFDRFIIGSIVGLGAVTYYIVPVDILVKFLVVPNAIVGALFPLATESLFSGSEDVKVAYSRSQTWIVLVGLPLLVGGILCTPWILRVWLGAEFARNATFVTRVIAVGVMASALSLAPFAMVQAAGFPHRTALLHLIEIPIYILLMYFGVRMGGIRWAAVLWTARAVVDAGVLFFMWSRIQPRLRERPALGGVP